tara:strand:+ start:917 stop:2305 length:1389 start_codon:yes stop_codon:yes gene_type:complete
MAISFPSNPTVGQQYTASGITWEWNGSSWESLPPSPGIGLTNLSVTQNAVGTAGLSYNNSSGVFSYTPPDLSSYLTAESDTLADVTSRGATTNQTISFSASKGISMDTASNNDFQIYGASDQKAYITHAQNNGAGGAGDLVVIAKNGLHVYGGTSETTANLGLEVTSGFSHLLYQGNSKLTTTNTGINVTGNIETDTLNVSGVSTFNSDIYAGLGESDIYIGRTSTSENSVYLRDNTFLRFGTGSDFYIVHDGSNAITKMREDGGTIRISADPLEFQNNDVTVATVTGGGISITGTSTCTGSVQVGSGQSFGSNTGSAAIYYGDGSNLTGVGGGLSSRSVVSATTGSVSVGATTNLDITGFKSYGLLKVGISSAAWVRLYVDASSRTSDSSRSYLTDPTPGSGLIAEVRTVTAGISTFLMTPGVIGYNNDASVGSTIYTAVTNNESSSSTITVDLTVLKMEN